MRNFSHLWMNLHISYFFHSLILYWLFTISAELLLLNITEGLRTYFQLLHKAYTYSWDTFCCNSSTILEYNGKDSDIEFIDGSNGWLWCNKFIVKYVTKCEFCWVIWILFALLPWENGVWRMIKWFLFLSLTILSTILLRTPKL